MSMSRDNVGDVYYLIGAGAADDIICCIAADSTGRSFEFFDGVFGGYFNEITLESDVVAEIIAIDLLRYLFVGWY